MSHSALQGLKTLPPGMRPKAVARSSGAAEVRPHSARHLGGSPCPRGAVAPWLRRGRRHRSQVEEGERGGGRGEEAGGCVGEGEAEGGDEEEGGGGS